MLLDHHLPSDRGKVAVVTRSPVFTRLLTSILESWKLKVIDDLQAAEMILAEWGITTTATAEQLVWLTPMPIDAPHFEIPLQLKLLYQVLEKQFFRSARRSIRIPMEEHPAELTVAGQRLPSQLISISARGVRMSCPVELAKQQKLTVAVVLGGHRLELPGEVIYAFPCGDAVGTAWPQLGVLFKSLDLHISEALERFVERTCVEQCCARIGLSMKSHCVSWLDVPRDPWAVLSGPGSI